MTAFIVSGGVLLEIGCPSTLSRETEQQVSFKRTEGGKRKAFIRKGGRRAWSVDVSVARPGEVSTLEAVARNLGPVGWYPPESVVGNLLSPQACTWDPVPTNASDGGLVQLPDGSVSRAALRSEPGNLYVGNAHGGVEYVPVIPGTPVTFGAWTTGNCQFALFWRGPTVDVGVIGPQPAPITGGPARTWREATVVPPATAAFVGLAFSQADTIARPSISWGPAGRDELGTGCPAAIVHSPSHAPVALWQGANYTDSSYQVTEVG